MKFRSKSEFLYMRLKGPLWTLEKLESSLIPAKTPSLACPVEIRFLLPSPPWFETFQVAFLWECMASGQSDSRERENV